MLSTWCKAVVTFPLPKERLNPQDLPLIIATLPLAQASPNGGEVASISSAGGKKKENISHLSIPRSLAAYLVFVRGYWVCFISSFSSIFWNSFQIPPVPLSVVPLFYLVLPRVQPLHVGFFCLQSLLKGGQGLILKVGGLNPFTVVF